MCCHVALPAAFSLLNCCRVSLSFALAFTCDGIHVRAHAECNALPDPRQCWILKERCLEYKCSNCTMFSLSFTYHASLVSRNRICYPFALPLFRLECFCHFSILLSLHQETVCQILCPITGMGKLQLQTGSRSPFSETDMAGKLPLHSFRSQNQLYCTQRVYLWRETAGTGQRKTVIAH